MDSLSKQPLPTDIVSISLNVEDEPTKLHQKEPKTLLELLQCAARCWPTHGIVFKDQGWDKVSDLVTYADLLRQAEVSSAAERTR